MNHPLAHSLIDIDAPLRVAGPDRLTMLRALERRILWLSTWMIHHANHVRPNVDGLKVGGHQASSASVATLMTALYLDVLRPSDRVAVKPHASPVFHAIQYLLGRQTREKLERFRAFGGVQSYPSRTKDTDDVDFSTGSVGLGVAITAFASLVQDYIDALRTVGFRTGGRRKTPRSDDRAGRATPNWTRATSTRRSCRRDGSTIVRNTVVDHRLQPPEPRRGGPRGAVRQRIDRHLHAPSAGRWCGIKYGKKLQRAAFARAGRRWRLRNWIDALSELSSIRR